jgi:serine/threonine protein kinase
MASAVQQIPPGEQIGPYQVVRRLGAGGMGEVYLARHRHLNRDAAIKVLLAEISMNQEVVARFFTEARATAQLRHPNIVEIFDCDVLADGRAFIVMEYLRGESLRNTLDRLGKLCSDYGSIAAIAGMVADGLQAAHASGIVHRDLKPDNVFLTSMPGQSEALLIKILDFGIAKLLSGGDVTGGGGTPTRTGSLIGTPFYMSPEQCRGVSTIDHRADIYSLGCMLFEMVVGRPPFVSDAPGDILMGHIMQAAPPLTSFQPDVVPEIDGLVTRMLAKDPADRPQSMAEIVAAIEGLLGLRKTDFAQALGRPAGFPEMVATTQILPSDDVTPPPVRRESPSGRDASTPMGSGRAAYTPVSSGGAGSPDGTWTPAPRYETPPAPASTPARHKSGSGPDSPSRQRSAAVETPLVLSDYGLKPSAMRRLLPAAIILLVVVVGGAAAYYLTKPNATSRTSKTTDVASTGAPKTPQFTPPAEVEVEVTSTPTGASVFVADEASPRGTTPTKFTLPRSSAEIAIVLRANGYLDKRLSIDASRNRIMSVNLEPREEPKAHEQDRSAEGSKSRAPRRRRSSPKAVAPPPSTTVFKAVGD